MAVRPAMLSPKATLKAAWEAQLLPFGKGFRKAGEAVLLGVGDKRLLAFKLP